MGLKQWIDFQIKCQSILCGCSEEKQPRCGSTAGQNWNGPAVICTCLSGISSTFSCSVAFCVHSYSVMFIYSTKSMRCDPRESLLVIIMAEGGGDETEERAQSVSFQGLFHVFYLYRYIKTSAAVGSSKCRVSFVSAAFTDTMFPPVCRRVAFNRNKMRRSPDYKKLIPLRLWNVINLQLPSTISLFEIWNMHTGAACLGGFSCFFFLLNVTKPFIKP